MPLEHRARPLSCHRFPRARRRDPPWDYARVKFRMRPPVAFWQRSGGNGGGGPAADPKTYRRSRRRTPGPPPSSLMNSTPAASKARRTAKSLAMVIDVSPSASSARLIVAIPKAAWRASSAALHRRRARAARIWALFNGFGFIVDGRGYLMIQTVSYDPVSTSSESANAIFQNGGTYEIELVEKPYCRPPGVHRRLGRADHHGQ
jgi:hypothetical protein